MRRPYEEWEKAFLFLAYPTCSTREIAKTLNRTFAVISVSAAYYKLKKEKVEININDKFEFLSILKQLPSKNKERRWLCKCVCGKTMSASTNTLTSGHSTSCGCKRIEAISKGHGMISGMWYGNIKRAAKKRKFEFSISIEYLNSLWIKQNGKCALTGMEINICKESSDYYEQNTASLDRINNNKPYIEGNVQFVHKHINYMKWTHDQDYFIELCKKVVNHVA